ncbi:MAG: adenosylmethionine decarboxylase [Candidatus Heimdallarchaeota archaeon]
MFGDPSLFCQRIAERSRLLEGEEGIRKIIVEMYRRQDRKISNKELAMLVKIPVPVLSAVRSELLNAGFLETKSIISPDAIKWIKSDLKLNYPYTFFHEFISSLDSPLSQTYYDFFKPVVTYLDKRPSPAYEYDQSRSTIETVLKRAMLMLLNGDVEGKRIIVMGDDDGVSLALAHLQCAEKILVLDIDPRVTEYVESFSKQYGFTSVLGSRIYDIRGNLQEPWVRGFNVFETDPPYTVPGFRLFIQQALKFLDPYRSGKGYISFGTKSPHSTWLCQQYLLENGFTISDFFSGFNEYLGSTILGNRSNLYVVSNVPQKYSIPESKSLNLAIYTADEEQKKKGLAKGLPSVGFQIIAEFYGVKHKLLTDASLLQDILQHGITLSRLKVDELFVKEYTPFGFSIIAILVESHCHLHTWPEHEYLALDLFVCEEQEKAEILYNFLIDQLEPLDYHSRKFFRGTPGRSY